MRRQNRVSSFPLLKLPGEIRNRVYKFCLVKRQFDGRLEPVLPYQPALTRVNRFVRGETLELFYASNRFEVFIDVVIPHYEVPGEEQKNIRFIRGIRNMVRKGYFELINELTIHLVSDLITDFFNNPGFRLILRTRLLKKKPYILSKPLVKDYHIDETSFYEVDRLDVGNTDWNYIETVACAVESHKRRLSRELYTELEYEAGFCMEAMLCGQMCEVLHALLGQPILTKYSKTFVFLYVHLLGGSYDHNAKKLAATRAYKMLVGRSFLGRRGKRKVCECS